MVKLSKNKKIRYIYDTLAFKDLKIFWKIIKKRQFLEEKL